MLRRLWAVYLVVLLVVVGFGLVWTFPRQRDLDRRWVTAYCRDFSATGGASECREEYPDLSDREVLQRVWERSTEIESKKLTLEPRAKDRYKVVFDNGQTFEVTANSIDQVHEQAAAVVGLYLQSGAARSRTDRRFRVLHRELPQKQRDALLYAGLLWMSLAFLPPSVFYVARWVLRGKTQPRTSPLPSDEIH